MTKLSKSSDKVRKCSIENCEGIHYSKGYCNKHYQRLRIHGDAEYVKPEIERHCSVEGCGKTSSNSRITSGMCNSHYLRYIRYDDPLGGCEFRERHGMSYSVEYTTWKNIKSRCGNTNDSRYEDYGGRGITVCERWKNSFDSFLEDMGKRPDDKDSIDRKNNDLGYTPDNCYWATSLEQGINRRLRKDNKSGFPGVSKSGDKWRVRISFNRQNITIGYFKIKEEAIQARKDAEKKYWQ